MNQTNLFESLLDGPKFSVTEFNKLLKETLNNMGVFRVEGEATEMRITTKKGVYITLADKTGTLKVSGYAPTIKGINLIERGMSVVVTGHADVYVPYGNLSLSISEIEPVGAGSLSIAYEKLKKALHEEGIFAEEHKLELPQFITRVALITGKESAAYADFTKILKENRQNIEVDFYPSIVQGPNSVKSVRDNLRKAQMKDYDVIVMTRGGGSLEDLKSFNDEDIVRDVYSSKTPIIVGVGHESDESLSDFAADVTASTPSQCAYYIVSRNNEFLESVRSKLTTIQNVIKNNIYQEKIRLDKTKIRYEQVLRNRLEKIRQQVQNLSRLLDSYDLQSVLKRGFAVLESEGKQVKSISTLKKVREVKVIMKDGSTNLITNCK